MSDLALPVLRSPLELALGGWLSSDERLARLVSRGSTPAFAVLYQRHHQALYRYCRSIVRDEDDAQDALQSAMMRALAALQARERDLAVRPWLFRIVHNEAISILRRRRPNTSLVDGLEPADGGVERTLEDRERFAQLIADLQSLAERQRGALVMRELSGLSIEEIAAALSTTPGAAKQVLFEARCALQEFAEGRAMECEVVRRAISDSDGRVLRGRKIRAHLRECRGCRDFQLVIGARSADLHALTPPLPAAAATAMLARLLAHGAGGGHAGLTATASGAALGNHAAASLTAKALAGVAIVAAATAGTVHLASGSHRHKPAPPPARRHAPLSSDAAGKDVSVRSDMRSSSSTTQSPRGGLRALLTGTKPSSKAPLAAQRTPAGASIPIGAQPAGHLPSQATTGRKASARGGPARRSSKHTASRPSTLPQSRRGGHGHHSSKQAHPPPPPQQQGEGGKKGQTPAPAGEHSHGHEEPNAPSQEHPGNKGHTSFSAAPPTITAPAH
jgi:RNA polymerase sigma factor (sigma-70 family)